MNEITENSHMLKTRHPELLRIKLCSFVDDLAAGVSLEEFKATVKTLERKPKTADALYSMQKNEITKLKDIVENVYEDHKIVEKYNQITELVKNCNTETKAWRPKAGDCEMQFEPYRKKILLEKLQKLTSLVNVTRQRRLLMEKNLAKKRKLLQEEVENIEEIHPLLERYETQIRELTADNKVLILSNKLSNSSNELNDLGTEIK